MSTPLRALPLVASLSLCVMAGCEPEPIVWVDVSFEVVGQGTIRVVYDDDSRDDLEVEVAICEADDPCTLEVREGSLLSAQARPATGFVFVGWQGDCPGFVDEVADVVVDDEVDCAAVFSPDPELLAEGPVLSLDVVGPGRLITTPALLDCHGTDPARAACTGQFLPGSVVAVQAIADPGAVFVGFFDDCDSLDEIAEVPMSADRRCGATFIENDVRFPVRVEVTGRGTVRSSPNGISCGNGSSRCRSEFAAGTVVSFTAEPSPGNEFVGWGHACAGIFDASFEFEVQFALACSAQFTRTFTVDIIGDGRVSNDENDVCTFEPCTWSVMPSTLTATADEGSRFVSWSGDCSGNDPVIDVDPEWSACTARFEPIPPRIVVTVEGPGRVVVADDVDPINCPGDCVSEGGGETTSVAPGPGFWTCAASFFGSNDGCDCGCGIPDPDCTSATVAACGFCEGGCGDGCSDIAPMQNHLCLVEQSAPRLELSAIADEHAVFLGWTGDCLGRPATMELVLDEATACTARFARQLTLEVVGPGALAAGALTCTSRCATTTIPATIVAQPQATARLLRWEGDCARADAPLSIPLGDDVGLCRAVFETIPPRLTLSTEGPGELVGVANCGDGCVVEGGAASLAIDVRAAADDGAVFAGWSGDCTGTEPSVRVVVPVASERRCTARFLAGFVLELIHAHGDVPLLGVLAVDQAGSVISLADLDGVVTRRDLRTGALLASLSPIDAGLDQDIVGLVDSGTGELLVLGSGVEHGAFIVGTDGARRSTLNAPHTAPLSAGAIGRGVDADVVCSGDTSGRVKVWSKATGLVQRTVVAHAPTSVLALGVTQGHLVSVGGDGVVALRRTNASPLIDSEAPLGGPAVAAAIANDRVVLGDDTGALAIVDVDIDVAAGLGRLLAPRTLSLPGGVRSLAVTDDDAIAALDDGTAVRVDLATLAVTSLLIDGVVDVAAGIDAFVVSTPTAVTALAKDGSVRRVFGDTVGGGLAGVLVHDDVTLAFDVAAHRLVRVEDERLTVTPGRAARDAAVHDDTVYLASLASGIEAVSLTTGLIRRVTPATSDVAALRVSDNGELLAAAMASGAADVVIYEAAIGETFRTYTDASGVVVDLAFLDDDRLAMVADTGSDGRLLLLQISTNTIVESMSLPFEPRALARRDGRLVIVGRAGQGGRLVVVETATSPAVLVGAPLALPAAAHDAAFSADDVVFVVDENTLHAVDLTERTIRASAPVPGTLRSIAAAPGPASDDVWTTSSEGVIRWRLRR